MSNSMYVWKLTKDQIESYKPGQDLGAPHKIVDIKPMSKIPTHKYDTGARYDQMIKK